MGNQLAVGLSARDVPYLVGLVVVLRVVLVYFYFLFEIEVASMMSVSCSYWIDRADVLDDIINTEFLPPVLAREEHRFGLGYVELTRA